MRNRERKKKSEINHWINCFVHQRSTVCRQGIRFIIHSCTIPRAEQCTFMHLRCTASRYWRTLHKDAEMIKHNYEKACMSLMCKISCLPYVPSTYKYTHINTKANAHTHEQIETNSKIYAHAHTNIPVHTRKFLRRGGYKYAHRPSRMRQ